MSKNQFGLGAKVQGNNPVSTDEIVFDTSLIQVPSCKKCCEACNGCKLRYFNKMKLNNDVVV
tara:strand:- start:4646 stop:4831 length:186 start_codon:yes stop_codon:yes gene_type:complete